MTNDNNVRLPGRYLILRPEEASSLELLRLLVSSDIKKRRLVESSETREPNFDRRWLILVTLSFLKFLKFFSKPLASLGSALNSNNTSSSSSRVDARMSPHKMNPKDGDKYHALLSIMCSNLSYDKSSFVKYVIEDRWNMKYLGLNDYWNEYEEKETTQVLLMSTDKSTITSHGQEMTVVVAFRGTEVFSSEDLCSDFDISWYEVPNIGKVHVGFMKALGLQRDYTWPKEPLPNPKRSSPLAYYKIRDSLKAMIAQNENTKFVLTGHSLGGALAILFLAVLMMHDDDEKELLERILGVYTFGQPRVGDSKFCEFVEKKQLQYDIKYYRFVYNNDLVPRLPMDMIWMFRHFGTCIYFDRNYQAKPYTKLTYMHKAGKELIFPESKADGRDEKSSPAPATLNFFNHVSRQEPDEKYFSLRGVIKVTTSGVMELKRSFTIVHERGQEFKEGWLLKFCRVLGITFPVATALLNHRADEYINATLLCPPSVFHIHTDVSIM